MDFSTKFLMTGVCVFMVGALAHADHSGVVYEQGSNKQKVIYNFVGKITKDDGKQQTVHAVYTDPEGKEAVTDDIIMEGSNIVRDEIHQLQTNQSGIMEVKDGRIYFTKTVDGKSSTKDEKLKDTFVVSGNFQKFIKDHWQPIADGKTVSFRYGVWDRQETVGFEIFKIGAEKFDGKDAVILKMKPSSFIIAALVNPIIFEYAADGSHLLAMNGRVPMKKKSGNSWKDLDAEVIYSYTEAAPATANPTPAVAVPAAEPAKK
jgi:hypothetical protein